MRPIRLHARVEADGEIHLRGLPMATGPEADIIVLPDGLGDLTDAVTLAMLQNDPAWTWLKDSAEDLYSEDDVQFIHRLPGLTSHLGA